MFHQEHLKIVIIFRTEENVEMQKVELKLGNFSEKRDMRKIYRAIALAPEFEYEKCPVLLVDVGMPLDLDFVEFKSKDGLCRVILTRSGLQDDDVIKIVTGRDKSYAGCCEDLPSELYSFLYTTKDMTTWYLLATRIANSTNTRCPQIMVHQCQNGFGGCSYNTEENYGKTMWIEINDRPMKYTINMIETLAHEMRHCWQHETDAKKYFENYHFVNFYGKNLENYYLQPAEVDACAYALRFINEVTGNKFIADKNYSKVNYAIERHAQKMSKKLFLPVKGMLA